MRGLSRRLLLKKVASVDAERAILDRIKIECSGDLGKKTETMFKDIALNSRMAPSFLDKLHLENLDNQKRQNHNGDDPVSSQLSSARSTLSTFGVFFFDIFLEALSELNAESEALMKEFTRNHDGLEFNFFVLEQGSWPIRLKVKTVNLPAVISSVQARFTEFYKSRRKGKCLTFVPHMSTALVFAKLDPERPENVK